MAVGWGWELPISRCGCSLSLSTFSSPQSAAAAPSPVLGNIPPNDGMPGGPIPPGFFQVRAGPLSFAPFTPGQAPGRREGGREREVSGSSVCHGLNTVALCWFRPFPSRPSLHPFQKPRRGEKKDGEQTPSCMCSVTSAGVCFLHTSFALTTQPAPGQGGGGLLPSPCRAVF